MKGFGGRKVVFSMDFLMGQYQFFGDVIEVYNMVNIGLSKYEL